MNETWRPVLGYEGLYEVSDLGRVRSLDRITASRPGRSKLVRGKLLKPGMTKGYLSVVLSSKAVTKHASIHRLVCSAFNGPCPSPSHQVRHLNGDCLDNRPVNLAWGTQSENARDSILHGTHKESRKMHCPAGHLYDELNTYRNKKGHRSCRECHRRQEHARWLGRRGIA